MGFALTVLLFYPGGMSSDSVSQLAQARSGAFSNWHPPLMAWAWRQIDAIWPGPIGMLALQAAAWWAGLALVAGRLLPGRAAAVMVLLVGLWPPYFGMIGTVWKDVHMAAAFTLAAGLLLSRRPAAFALALAAIAYGTAMRHNGVLAAAPLATYAAWRLSGFALKGPAARGLVAGALAVVTLLAPVAVNQALTRHDAHMEQLLFAFDLAGMSVRTGLPLVPAVIHARPLQPGAIEAAYDPNYVDPLYPATLRFTDDPQTVAELRSAWRAAIAAHPAAYLAHRLSVTLRLWGLHPQVWYAYHRGVVANELGVPEGASPINAPLFAAYWVLKFSPIFRPFFYLLALMAGLVMAFRVRRRHPRAGWAIAVALSGLLYAGPNVLVAIAADLRYHLWAIVATSLMALGLWGGRLSGAPAAEEAVEPERTVALR